MLNDYGKSLFRPWLSVQNVVLALAIVFVISLLKMTSTELASWAQAIGSVVAIWGAFKIGNRQIEHQQAQSEKQRKDKAAAFFAVVENAVMCSYTIYEFTAVKAMGGREFSVIWRDFLADEVRVFVRNLEAIPAHELGSYRLVSSHGAILGEMIKVSAEIEKLISGNNFDNVVVKAFYDRLTVFLDRINISWNDFKNASGRK